MTGDQLYDRTKAILCGQPTPRGCYWAAKLFIKFHFMEKVEGRWRWKRGAA